MELTIFHCLISISMATQEMASSSHGIWNGYEFENTSPWIWDENHSFYFYFLNFCKFFLKSPFIFIWRFDLPRSSWSFHLPNLNVSVWEASILPFNRIKPVIELSKYLTLSQNMHEFYNFVS